MAWFRHDAARGVLTLFVQAQPGARKTGIEPHGADLLKVKVTAPAVDGRANAAVCALIAERLGVAPSAVMVMRGGGTAQAGRGARGTL